MCLMFNVKTNKGWQSVYLLTEVYGSERKSPRFLWRQRWVRLCSSNLIMVLWLVKHNTCLVLTVFLSTWWYMNRILKPLFLGKNAKYLRYLILCLLWIMHWESWPNMWLWTRKSFSFWQNEKGWTCCHLRTKWVCGVLQQTETDKGVSQKASEWGS